MNMFHSAASNFCFWSLQPLVIIVTGPAVKLPQRIDNAFNTSHACAVITGSDNLNLTAIFPEGVN